MTPDLAAVVAKVLAAHVQGFAGVCACGWKSQLDPFRPGPEYRAHVAAEVTNALTTALAAIETHNGTPVTPDNLRWAATHESLCRSWTYDVLMGLAEALGAGEAQP